MNEHTKCGITYNGIFAATKKNEVLTHARTWMSLENFMLSEISHM